MADRVFVSPGVYTSEKDLSFTGSSGSSLEDLKRALSMVEQGALRSDRIVRAVGGLKALKQGVKAVQEGTYAGKVVIYPHLEDLPLMSIEDVKKEYSDAASKLDSGHWTREAEQMLFNTVLGGNK